MAKNVAVIGTIFVDYKGFSHVSYHAQGRNLGKVEIVAGGVGRNVAVNLAHLNVATWLAGTVDNDSIGREIKQKIHESGVNIACLKEVPQHGMGKWLAILDQEGNLMGSISQMPDESILQNEISPVLPKLLPNINALVLEIDLGFPLIQEVIERANKHQCQIYALPGNLSVIGQHFDLFQFLECFVCNKIEAESLMGKQGLDTADQMLAAMSVFKQQHKIKNFVVTMGERGAVYLDNNGSSGHQNAIIVDVIDTSGAGDSFFSAVVAAMIYGKTLAQAVALAAKVAALVVSQIASDCSGAKQDIHQLLTDAGLTEFDVHSNFIPSTL